jgi:hypothetical protein
VSVYKKLQDARIRLLETELKKSGHNKFAGYQYFELGDFLPSINRIFADIGLCGVVSFGSDLAILEIHDVDGGEPIRITSPMAEANLKGCHPIQNLGAVETYTRRYLWVSAMEIVEHDAIDAAKPEGKITSSTPNAGAGDSLDQDKKNYIADLAIVIKDRWEMDEFVLMYEEYLTIKEVDDKNYLWSLLDSKIRAKIKLIGQERKVNG